MKKKVLATVVTLALGAMVLAGCGSSHESGSTANYEESTGPAVYADEVDEGPAEIAEPDDEPYGLADVTGENDDFGQVPEEDQVPWDEDYTEQGAEGETVEAGEAEGIIVLTLYPGPSSCMYAIVDAVDPNTTNVQNILSLQIPSVIATNEYGYIMPLDTARFGNFQDQFSPDFSKMAITRVRTSNQSMHAGWLDEDGNFFDVTAAVGEAEVSDFEDPVRYQAVGFTDDGATFVYRRVDDYSNYAFEALGYYAVSIDNITAGSSWELSPSDLYLHDDDGWRWLGDYRFSDKIDETHFYADNGNSNTNSCVLIDIESQTMSEFIPGETRNNWSVVVSPDGQQVAFMSRPKSGQLNSVELYTMNLSNHSANHVLNINSPEGAHLPTIRGEYNGVDILCTTIDWR